MIRQGHIGPTEATAMLTILIVTKVFLNFPRIITTQGETGAWLLLLLQGAATGLWLIPLVILLRRFPGQSWGEIGEAVLGRYLGKLAIFPVWLFFMLTTGLVLREFAGAFKVNVLLRTPAQFTMALVVAVTAWAVLAGLETVARLAVLFTLPIGILAGVMFGTAAPNVRVMAFFPVLGPGWRHLGEAAFLGSGNFAELILLGYINSWLRDPRDLPKVATLSFLFALTFMEAAVLLTLGVFSIPAAHRIYFPLLELARASTLTAFVQNFEAVFTFLWMFVASLRISIGLYASTVSFLEIFNLRNFNGLVIPLGFLVYHLGLLPDGLFQAIVWNEVMLRRWGWALTLVPPVLILALAVVRGKRGLRT